MNACFESILGKTSVIERMSTAAVTELVATCPGIHITLKAGVDLEEIFAALKGIAARYYVIG